MQQQLKSLFPYEVWWYDDYPWISGKVFAKAQGPGFDAQWRLAFSFYFISLNKSLCFVFCCLFLFLFSAHDICGIILVFVNWLMTSNNGKENLLPWWWLLNLHTMYSLLLIPAECTFLSVMNDADIPLCLATSFTSLADLLCLYHCM